MRSAHQSLDSSARRLWALQTFVLLLLLWLALDGVDAIGVGLAVAALGALLGGWLAPGEPYPWRPLRLLAFSGYFLCMSLRGGIDVARRALHPRLLLSPGYFEHRCRLPPGLPRTVFIGVISLLPGTLAVELRDDGCLQVHALVAAGTVETIAALERRVARLFSLDAAVT